jgi:predicted dehydrogenase
MKVGLIGCGRVAHIHMAAYKKMNNVNVVAVADADIARAKAFAKPYKIEKATSNYKDFFENGSDLDFIDICTPTSTHVPIITDAANSKLNVLTEKPLGRSSAECEKIVDAVRKSGISLCVCHNQLYFPHVKHLKSIAESNDFNLVSFRTSHRENFEWLKAHDLAQSWNVSPEHGGILWEVGTHLAYLQLSFLKDIEEVYALGTKAKYSVYDDFVVLLRSSSHRWGIMEISWVAQESEIVYEVINSAGRRVQTYLPHGYIIERNQKKAFNAYQLLGDFLTDEKRFFTKWNKFTKDQIRKPQLGHFDLIKDYVDSLEKGRLSPVTAEDGRNAIRLLECIEESLNTQRPVKYSSL